MISSSTTSTTIPSLGVRLTDVTSTQSTTKASPCGRFQFQCQTSKECIAVRYDMIKAEHLIIIRTMINEKYC